MHIGADKGFSALGRRFIRRPALLCLAITVVTAVVYAPVWHFNYICLDDPDYVSDNLVVRSGLTFRGVVWAFSGAHFSNWHPLTWLSHMFDCELFGLNPGAHHLINVAIHVANAVLLLLVLAWITGKLWRSALVAALFALHPLHVESVAWISERKDILSALFWILTIAAYAWYAQRQSIGRYLAVVALFGCGLLSKPMVVTLPFVLLLLDYWPLYRIRHLQPFGTGHVSIEPQRLAWLILEKVPLLALSGIVSAITFLAQRQDAMVSLDVLPLGIRLKNAIVSYGGYLWKALLPFDLAVIYPLLPNISTAKIVGALFVLVLFSVVAVCCARMRPYLLVGWLWYVGSLVPVIGVVQVGEQAMADRYTYLPLIGIFVAVAWGIADFAAQWKIRWPTVTAMAAVLIGMCTKATSHQLQYWRGDVSLFSQAIRVTSHNATAHALLANALLQLGEDEKAKKHFEEALRIQPRSARIHYQCGLFQAKQKQYEEAANHYRQAIHFRPNHVDAYNELGVVLSQLGRSEEAVNAFNEAIERKPDNAKAYNNRGIAWVTQGQSAAALVDFRSALQYNPNQIGALKNLAWLEATDENEAIRNGVDAVRLARRACELTRFRDLQSLEILAASYAETGDFDMSIQTVHKALDLLPVSSDQEVDSVRQRLMIVRSSYQARKPFRRKSDW